MESLTADEVRYIAKLANLYLTEDEVEMYRHQLTGILDHVQSLQEIDTEGVEPTGHATEVNTVLRDDEPGTPLERDQVLANAPSTSGEFIRVRTVLD
jgi:aspartyl-tRNA(Asn)/glutamyl-tRNA(Gln) amidotransferase subunit C